LVLIDNWKLNNWKLNKDFFVIDFKQADNAYSSHLSAFGKKQVCRISGKIA